MIILTLRYYFDRLNHSPDFKENDEEIYRAVHRDYKRVLNISRSKYEKVAEYINEIFRSLANYDVRFEFDPMVIDDDKCEIVSQSELRFICQLKHFSEQSFEVIGDASDGRVQIKLRDDAHRYKTDYICSLSVIIK